MARNKGNGAFVLGVLLLVVGAAALAYGYFQYDQAQSSLATIGKKLIGKTSAAVSQSIAIMIGGGAAALVGAFLAFIKKSR